MARYLLHHRHKPAECGVVTCTKGGTGMKKITGGSLRWFTWS
jgi:hypothetical protein